MTGDCGYAEKSEAGATPGAALPGTRLEIEVLTAGLGHSLVSLSQRSGLWRGGLLWATNKRSLSERTSGRTQSEQSWRETAAVTAEEEA